jgi:HD-GYP domain-containing protein (c-di-GMP phosphodiesterase class II)
VIKSHAFHSHNILAPLEEIKDIAELASFHHERLDGRGYPFHLTGDKMTLGCKIMAVADVFAALIEDRSYRKGMSPDKALQIVNKMVDDSALDRNVVSQLESNINEVASACLTAQGLAAHQYKDFVEALN